MAVAVFVFEESDVERGSENIEEKIIFSISLPRHPYHPHHHRVGAAAAAS